MFVYEKKLQYPVRIKNTNPQLASFIISQYGGPDGELGASMRYLSQRYAMPFPEAKGLLTDIGTEGSFWTGGASGDLPSAPRRSRLRHFKQSPQSSSEVWPRFGPNLAVVFTVMYLAGSEQLPPFGAAHTGRTCHCLHQPRIMGPTMA